MERQRVVRDTLAEMRELALKLDPLGSRSALDVLRGSWG
jgi:hypothetical protein